MHQNARKDVGGKWHGKANEGEGNGEGHVLKVPLVGLPRGQQGPSQVLQGVKADA